MKKVLSIISALIITILAWIVLIKTYHFLSLNLVSDSIPFIVLVFLGGVISTWYSTGVKIKYSVYYGLILVLIYGFYFGLGNHLLTMVVFFLIAAMGGYTAKNEKDLWENKSIINYKTFFINLYKRNSSVLIASSTIFFVSALVGGIYPFISVSFHHFIVNFMIVYLSALVHMGHVNTLSIFLNNSTIAVLNLYIYGLFFGIPPTIGLIETGLIIGFSFFQYPFTIFYILPHGVLESAGYIVASAAGFKLLITALNMLMDVSDIEKSKSLDEQIFSILDMHYLKFRDSLILVGIAIVLLVVAAVIEGNFSGSIGNHITGLNIHTSFASYLLNLIHHHGQ